MMSSASFFSPSDSSVSISVGGCFLTILKAHRLRLAAVESDSDAPSRESISILVSSFLSSCSSLYRPLSSSLSAKMSVSRHAASAVAAAASSADFRSSMAKPNRLLTLLLHVLIMVVVFSVGLLFLGIAILFVIHVFLIRRAFESSPDEDFPSFASRSSSWSSSCGLSRFDLQRLPCFDYRNGYPADCAVCLEAFGFGDRCRSLPSCKHNFHAHCVDAWLAVASVCPICRTTVRPPD